MALSGSTIKSTFIKLLRMNSDTMGVDVDASYLQDSADTDSALSISTTRVGIGTPAPGTLLHIKETGGAHATLKIEAATDAYDPEIRLVSQGDEWLIRVNDDTSGGTDNQFNIWNGSDLLTILPNGNVGIGTTSPGFRLEVELDGERVKLTGGSGKPDLHMHSDVEEAGGSSGKFSIELQGAAYGNNYLQLGRDDSGHDIVLLGNGVGIGTTSPGNLLHIEWSDDANPGGGTGLLFTNSEGSIAAGQLLGTIGFDSTDGNVPSNNLHASAFIAAYAAESHGESTKGGDLAFGTAINGSADDTASTEHMRILDSGNVGIGTASPQTLLHVEATARGTVFDADVSTTWADVLIRNPTDTDNAATGIRFVVDSGDSDTDRGAGIACIKEDIIGELFSLAFIVDGNAVPSSEAMRIRYNGNVGIGTTEPLTNINSGSYLKPDSSGTFLTISGGDNGGFMMVEGGTTTDDDIVGGYYINNTGGQQDAHRTFAGLYATYDGNAEEDISGCKLHLFAKPSGSGSTVPNITISGPHVGIGETSPTAPLHVQSDPGDNQEVVLFRNMRSSPDANDVILSCYWDADDGTDGVSIKFGDGNHTLGQIATIAASGTAIAYQTSSDYRMKENAVPIDYALTKINQLKPYNLNFIGNDNKIDSFYAHEVQEVLPYAASGVKDAMYDVDEEHQDYGHIKPQQVNYGAFVPILVAAIQELSAKVTALENNNNQGESNGESNQGSEDSNSGEPSSESSGEDSGGAEGSSSDSSSSASGESETSESSSDDGNESSGGSGSDSSADSEAGSGGDDS